VSRPADWTPLATADPVPGDPVQVALVGRRLKQAADQIGADVSWLRSLCTAPFWDSGAGQAFLGHVESAAAELDRARERYLAAGQALGGSLTDPGYAGALGRAQSLSLRALTQAQQAWPVMRAQLAAVEAAGQGLVPYAGAQPRLDSSGNPVLMAAPADAGPRLSAAVSLYNASALEYRTANGWLAEAVALRDEAAAGAAAQILAAAGPGVSVTSRSGKSLAREMNYLGSALPGFGLECGPRGPDSAAWAERARCGVA
jgi:hypothetical protein